MSGPRLAGKIALISGGASGIGAASARRFVEEGAQVMLGDLQADKGQALARELGAAAAYTPLDVRDEASWRTAAAAAQARFGGLTTVINSAGVSIPGTIEEIGLEQFRHTLAINLDGTFLGCKVGVEALRGGQGGAIVNVG
jgi:3(or 17)beta-hydroxysteroid dehydrogenase